MQPWSRIVTLPLKETPKRALLNYYADVLAEAK